MKARRIIIQPFNVSVRILRTKKERTAFEIPDDALGYCMTHEKEGFIITLPWKYDEETTWHEAHHLARWLNDIHGIPTSTEEHEIDVYLQEHIVREIKTTY